MSLHVQSTGLAPPHGSGAVMFFLYRGGKGQAKCPIDIANLVLFYNKCMEGQYGKGEITLGLGAVVRS